MPLSFSEAAFVVAWSGGIAKERLETFHSRMKQWQKMGFPDGTQVGKGRRAEYGATQIFQLVLLVRLLRVGLTPERAQAVIRVGWDHFKGGIMEAITCQANDADHLHYYMIQMDALSDLTTPEGSDHEHIYVSVFTDTEMLMAWDEPGDDWSEEEQMQHRYSRFITRNRMAIAISVEIDSLLMFVWMGLHVMGKGPEIFADEFAVWLHECRTESDRFSERGGGGEESRHFDEDIAAQSVHGRDEKFDHVEMARAALSKASEDDLRPQA